jgi:hypothetical protein
VIDYEYNECVSAPYEMDLAIFWRDLINGIHERDSNYYEKLRKDNVPNDRVKGKDRNNIVNLTFLVETILLMKYNYPKLVNLQMLMHHDEIETVQDYIKINWNYENLDFISSTNSLQVQICDNISSIVGNLIKHILPLHNDSDLHRLMKPDYEWVKRSLRNIFNRTNPRNTKFVVSVREIALIKSILSGIEFSNLNDFKEDILKRLRLRLDTEKHNYLDFFEAKKILKR